MGGIEFYPEINPLDNRQMLDQCEPLATACVWGRNLILYYFPKQIIPLNQLAACPGQIQTNLLTFLAYSRKFQLKLQQGTKHPKKLISLLFYFLYGNP